MKYKILIGISMLVLLFLVGCGLQDKTAEMCKVLQYSSISDMDEFDIKFEDGVCIIEEENVTNSYYVTCKTFTQRASLIIKANDEVINTDDLPWQCDIIEI